MIESIYRSCGVVDNICVYAAVQDQTKPVAIVVPNEPAPKQVTSDYGIQGSDLEDLCLSKKFNDIVLK